jgi:L-amino acid N-acyltransferase YncA
MMKRILKRDRHKQLAVASQEQRLEFIANQIPEVNPNSPRLPVYLRPAFEQDVPGIADIWNYYILNSNIPQEQTEISCEDIKKLLQGCNTEKLPFIVVIKGTVPKNNRTKKGELVLGFAYADAYYGRNGSSKGRDRYTATLQVYVHQNYLRKKLGTCLMDRILQSMSTCASRDGYDWINPKNDSVYFNMGGMGGRRYHQVLMERTFELKEDPDFEWVKIWLKKFSFFDVGRLRSIARSSCGSGPARFLDVVQFQLQADDQANFPPIM